MATSLIASIMSFHLTSRGLPAPVDRTVTGEAQVDPNYPAGGVSASSFATISGLGQLLSSTSTFGDGLDTLADSLAASDNSSNENKRTSSSDSDVATATINNASLAVADSYAVVVSNLATAQTTTSALVSDADASQFGSGEFNITLGGVTSSILVETGSLNGIRDAINNAGVGVTASVSGDSTNGYSLSIVGNSTGASNSFTLTAPQGNPFNTLASNFGSLGFYTATAAADASYTVDGAAQTSASNTGATLANGVTANLLSTGNATLSVFQSFSQATSSSSAVATVASSTLEAGAVAGEYSLNVRNIAAAQTTRTVSFGTGDGTTNRISFPGTFYINAGGAGDVAINVVDGSLNGIRDAINAANAGVTASVGTDGGGVFLSISGDETGAANAFTISNPTGGLTSADFAVLSFSDTVDAEDAKYTIDGGLELSSASNSAVSVAGASVNFVASGTTTLTIDPTVNTSSSTINNLQSAASGLVTRFNTLQSNLAQLLSAGQPLNGNATATAQQSALNALVSTADATSLGFSLAGNTLSINSSTLQSSFSSDSVTTTSKLQTLIDNLITYAEGAAELDDPSTAGDESGTLQAAVNAEVSTIEADIQTVLNGAPASDPVPSWVAKALTYRAVSAQGSIVLPGFSSYA